LLCLPSVTLRRILEFAATRTAASGVTHHLLSTRFADNFRILCTMEIAGVRLVTVTAPIPKLLILNALLPSINALRRKYRIKPFCSNTLRQKLGGEGPR
jgi:hypothetical protein